MSKYALYIGDNIQTVSLWVRDGDNEYPIYANTRGVCEWFSFDREDYENCEPHQLSDELITWLAEYHRRIKAVGPTTDNSELPELEWYEQELLNAIATPKVTPEQFDLMEWAYEVEQ